MLLSIKNLSKNYVDNLALDGVTLDIPCGRIVGLLGPNGSGKTTLLKIIAGLLQPTWGEVKVEGMPIGVETKKLVSFLPERTYLDSSMKVFETLDYFQEYYEDFDREKAEKMLSVLGVKPYAKLKTLSKGTKEKVQLILVMSRKAKLYLLDEPIGGVDPATRDFILNVILKDYKGDATIIVSTHLISDVEEILDDYIFINNGKIIDSGDVKAKKEETGKSVDELFREMFRCY